MKLATINPMTGETVKTFPAASDAEIGEALDASVAAFIGWRSADFPARAGFLRKAGAILRKRKAEFARLMALEMGKPLREGQAECEKCALTCDFYAENAARFLAPEPVPTEAAKSFITFNPLGVVLGIMPWNFPFWQVFRFAAPTLMAGNAIILKHAANVPQCALAIEEVFLQAGLPQGLFKTLLLTSDQVVPLIADSRVFAVTLTGSTGAGRAVAAAAGKAIKKCVLELGGSDAYVILDDADLEKTVSACVSSRLINSGQSCIAAKRFIVTPGAHEEFTRRFVDAMKEKRAGDPMDPANAIGPLARVDLRDSLHDQVERSVKAGARLLLGGRIPDGPGAFYPPTVLAEVEPGMPAFDEELFGPIAAIIRAKDEFDAIRLANLSQFGLGAAVFTRNQARGERIAAEEFEAGACFVNALVKSDPRLPFGGVKESGFGRELGSFGIREFVNVKTVWVEP